MEDDDVDDEVFVGESVSVGERVAKAKARAIEKNKIIVIDEDTKPPSNAAKSVGDITSKGNKMNADEAATARPRRSGSASAFNDSSVTPAAEKVKAELSAKFATAKRSNGSIAAVTDSATSFDKQARVTPLLCVVNLPTVASSNAKANKDFISDNTEFS